MLVKKVVEVIDSLVESDILSGFASMNCVDEEYDFYTLSDFVSYLKEQLSDNGNDMKVSKLPIAIQQWIEDFMEVEWTELFNF